MSAPASISAGSQQANGGAPKLEWFRPLFAHLLSSLPRRQEEELLFPLRQKVQNIQKEAGAHRWALPPPPPIAL